MPDQPPTPETQPSTSQPDAPEPQSSSADDLLKMITEMRQQISEMNAPAHETEVNPNDQLLDEFNSLRQEWETLKAARATKPASRRAPAQVGVAAPPDISGMSVEQRTKHYTEVVAPALLAGTERLERN